MRPVRTWLAVWTGWTALALFFAVSNSLTYRASGRPGNWALSIKRSVSEWWMWAALTPPIVWLAGRFPLYGDQLARNIVVHVVAGAALAVFKTTADRLVFALVTGFWMYWLVSTLALNFVLYGVIVAAAHGMEYYRRSREREQLEARLAETRLQLLGMQLQPHFLFNTLNTIAEMVHEDPDKADTMIAGLSDLLRRSLDLGTVQEIPLAEEIDLVLLYLEIQKARFGDRLRVELSIADDTRQLRVPALLLQPLVENAIRHGLAARVDAGRIHIEARTAGGVLVITVTDDGVEHGETTTGPERVGLGNTRARLEALYGSAGRLDLTPAGERGTCVTVRIPARPRQ
jgi:two-component system LytT family sensor kinase